MSRRFRLVISGAFALLAIVLCAAYAQHVREEAESVRADALARYGGEVVSLVVADDAIEEGDVIDSSNVSVREWLADLAPAGAVTSVDDVIGSQVTIPVAAGAPLTSLNFRAKSQMVSVPSGHVALSLPVTDKLGLASSVTAGTPLCAYRVDEGGAEVISTDIEVLVAPVERTGISSASTITIAVPSSDVPGMLSASAEGSLRLVVPADDVEAVVEGVVAAPSVVSAEGGEAA